MAKMKLKHLESNLQDIDTFERPKLHLEQYPTTPHLAACMLHTIESKYGDLAERDVADLGCGCGVLSIGAVMLGASRVQGYDIDPDALEVCRRNLDDFDLTEEVSLREQDLLTVCPADTAWRDQVDTVVMNPPFGTKNNEGIDMHFVQVGLALAKNSVYSLHKTSTREHIEKMCSKWGVSGEVEAKLRYNLDRSMRQHRRESVDIEVDFWRFSFADDKQTYKQYLDKMAATQKSNDEDSNGQNEEEHTAAR